MGVFLPVLFMGLLGFFALLILGAYIATPDEAPAGAKYVLAGLLVGIAVCWGLLRVSRRRGAVSISAPGLAMAAVACLVVFVGGLVVFSLVSHYVHVPRPIGRAAVLAWILTGPAATGTVLRVTAARTHLFSANGHGVTVRNRRLPWPTISTVVAAPGRNPGTAELGVAVNRPIPDPLPLLPGENLSDLPYRVVVPAGRVDMEQLRRMVEQAGQSGVLLIERTYAGSIVRGTSRPTNSPYPPYPR